MLDLADVSRRWPRVIDLMARHDLDVLVAIDTSRDEIMLGGQRWLTGFTPLGQPAAALVFRDGHVELISAMLGRTAPAFYGASDLPIELVPGFSPALIAERIARVGAKRVGVGETATLAANIADAVRATPSAPELVDVAADFLALRLVKSAAELAMVRASAASADAVWRQVPDLFRSGRRFYEIVADADHIVKSLGGEGGFYLLAGLPITGMPMRVVADPEAVVAGGRYMLEISPRVQGYYSQLTAPVVTGEDAEIEAAYADVVAAKEMAQPLMVPGADLSAIAVIVESFLKERGRVMASRSLGHFCGMALEEPRHDPSQPFILREGMTLIFHPVLAHPAYMSLMRADTYVIGVGVAERLNAYPMAMVQVG